nr:hypothetical protein [Tanacetum cinerariifolium]
MDSYEGLRRNTYDIYPFDYRVTLGFRSIAGGLDPVSPVIRLPIEREINSGTRIGTAKRWVDKLIPGAVNTWDLLKKAFIQRSLSSSSITDGLSAIVSKLDNLGHDMKKLKEHVHAIQVGCYICEGPHLDKECPLNEEVRL